MDNREGTRKTILILSDKQEVRLMNEETLRKRIKLLLIFFMAALVVSGLTAIPLKWELTLLESIYNIMETDLSISIPPLGDWIHFLKTGVVETLDKYPFIFLGTDWLAFGHIIIALSFLGAVRDPVKNIWGIQVGVIACVILTPWAFIFGSIREIPIFGDWWIVHSG